MTEVRVVGAASARGSSRSYCCDDLTVRNEARWTQRIYTFPMATMSTSLRSSTTARMLASSRRQLLRRHPFASAASAAPNAGNRFDHMNPHNLTMLYRSMVMVTKTKSDEPLLALKANGPAQSVETATQRSQAHDQEVVVTDSCYKRIHQLVTAKQQNNLYLRVFVDAGGCSGFTYKFELDTDDNLNANDDVVFTEPSSVTPARVVVDHGSLELIAGSKIDYVQEMIKSTFEVRENPQSESACGCGSSFALKNFSSNPAMD